MIDVMSQFFYVSLLKVPEKALANDKYANNACNAAAEPDYI